MFGRPQNDEFAPDDKGEETARNVPAYMTIEGKKQKEIKGSCTIAPHEGTHEVVGYRHHVKAPKDKLDGGAIGKRQHGYFEVWLKLDESTPQLYQACCSNENLTRVTLKLYRTSDEGDEECYFSYILEDAQIAELADSSLPIPGMGIKSDTALERVKLTYRKICWDAHKLSDGTGGQRSASDDWEAPTKV